MRYVIIPARLASRRLPNKLLLPVCGRPLIWHTIKRTLESKLADKVYVATEDKEIFDVVRGFGLNVEPIMTSEALSGTERIASLAEKFANAGCTQIVNFQGDEPLIPGHCIDELFEECDKDVIATFAAPICNGEYDSPHVVKVVTNFDGRAMYFSRACIPYKDPTRALKHIGLYAYPIDFLLMFHKIPKTTYPSESLEQLAWLQYGWEIQVIESHDMSLTIGIDTEEDYKELIKRIS